VEKSLDIYEIADFWEVSILNFASSAHMQEEQVPPLWMQTVIDIVLNDIDIIFDVLKTRYRWKAAVTSLELACNPHSAAT
jgi:hypothetical protein